jgi:hypothetical protein
MPRAVRTAVSRRSLVAVLVVTGVIGCASAAAFVRHLPSPEWLRDQVKILSAPEMAGRASGTPGIDRAAAHIARTFQRAGLRPGGDSGGFLQRFSVPTGIRLGAPNTLVVLGPTPRALALNGDFVPLATSTDGNGEGDLAFVGYGITAPDLGYDDYAGLDVRDKIVLAVTREPRSDDPASPFRRPEAYHYAERSHKVINAREHGARAILLVPHPAAGDALPSLRGVSQPLGIMAAAITRLAADSLLGGTGARLADLARGIDQALAPRSFLVAGVRLRLAVTLLRDRGITANVIGIVPGTDPRLRDDAIVIGAHYDHLGRGGEGSLAPDEIGALHPGADDNASGTAVIMGLARAFTAGGGVSRTLVFVGFAGEEMGLLGSAHYVRHPAFPLDRTILMLNLDMVGRLREGKLYVGGVDSGSGLRKLVADAVRGLSLSPDLRGDPYAPSDHTSFYAAGRPVLFLFTGAHADYHRPSDTWDKVNAEGVATVATLAARLIDALAASPTAPVYARIAAPSTERRRGYGAFFGVVPEFGDAPEPGVRVSGVRAGSPAEKAGVVAGDRVVKFAGVEVKTLEDLTFALRGRRSGDRVSVVVVRDGRERQLEATLEERR